MYLHNLDPYAIQLSQDMGIRWYGLSYLSGFVAAYYIVVWMVRRGLSPLSIKQAGDFIFAAALGTIIGGRLGYCLMYNPELFARFDAHFPFWGALAINEGGMASHGGILGILIASIIWGRRNQINALHLADLTTLGGSIGIFFGRIANFVNGELVGRVCQTQHAWCVKFPQDILLWPSKEPARLPQLSAPLSELGLDSQSWLSIVEKSHFETHSWSTLNLWLEKLILAVQQGNLMVAQKLAPLLDARHPSQLYEALLEGLFLFLILLFAWRKARKPGVICGLFFMIYSAVRVLGEQFRMPDAHIGFQLWGLTRGQWLSFGLFALGCLILVVAKRYSTPALGGWSNNHTKQIKED